MFDNIVTVYRNSADVWFYAAQLVASARRGHGTARHTGPPLAGRLYTPVAGCGCGSRVGVGAGGKGGGALLAPTGCGGAGEAAPHGRPTQAQCRYAALRQRRSAPAWLL